MGQYPSGFFLFLPMKRYFTLALVASLFLSGVEAKERTMDEKQAIASSVLTMQSQTRGKAELTLRLLQASDTYTVLGDDSRFVVVSNDDAFDAVIGYADSPFDASAVQMEMTIAGRNNLLALTSYEWLRKIWNMPTGE